MQERESAVAAALARRRWRRTTKAERVALMTRLARLRVAKMTPAALSAHGRLMAEGRRRKARMRAIEARLAAAQKSA